MAASAREPGRERAAEGRGAVVVPQEPPPWIARAAGWIVVAMFLLAGVAAFVVRIPETIELPCVLVDAASHAPGLDPDAGVLVAASFQLEERDLPRVVRGQRVRVLLDALPFERYGSFPAWLEWVSPTPVESPDGPRFTGIALLATPTGSDALGRRPWRLGMKGRARVAVGARTPAQILFSSPR